MGPACQPMLLKSWWALQGASNTTHNLHCLFTWRNTLYLSYDHYQMSTRLNVARRRHHLVSVIVEGQAAAIPNW